MQAGCLVSRPGGSSLSAAHCRPRGHNVCIREREGEGERKGGKETRKWNKLSNVSPNAQKSSKLCVPQTGGCLHSGVCVCLNLGLMSHFIRSLGA